MAKNYKNGDPCPICDHPLQVTSVTETFTYKGSTLEYPEYVVHKCNGCQEEFVGDDTMRSSTRRIRDFHREVDGFLTSTKIKEIRMKLGYTQDNLGRVLGGGVKAFARYENGDVTQSKSMDNLLRILDAKPEAITVLDPTTAKNKCNIISMHVLHNTKTNYSDNYARFTKNG